MHPHARRYQYVNVLALLIGSSVEAQCPQPQPVTCEPMPDWMHCNCVPPNCDCDPENICAPYPPPCTCTDVCYVCTEAQLINALKCYRSGEAGCCHIIIPTGFRNHAARNDRAGQLS